MAKETLLLSTADNHVIAVSLDYSNVAEKSRKMRLYEQLSESLSYHEFFIKFNNFVSSGVYSSPLEHEFFLQVDSENTSFLQKEINHFDFVKRPEQYKNNLKDNNFPADVASKPDTIHFDNHIDDAEIPPLVKNLGFSIVPEDKVYDVYYNTAKQEYEIKDFNLRRASVNVIEKRVRFVRNHFTFSPADYSTLQRLIAHADNERRINHRRPLEQIFPNPKERSLYKIYLNERVKVEKQLLLFKHELTHVKNTVLQAGYCLKKGAKRLSVEDNYRLQVEDERSAYLSQVINATNTYLQKGNPKDFSMFDAESSYLLAELRNIPETKRFEYVQEPKNLLKAAFKSFAVNHRKSYDDKQFVDNMKLEMEKIPLSAEPDNDRKEFFKRRSLLFHYRIYNPQTKQLEEKSLAPLIDNSMEVNINSDNLTKIIEPCRQILTRRLAEFNRDQSRGVINPALVEEAKSLMRSNLKKSKLVTKVNGMEISELAEERTPAPNAPAPQPKPRQPTEWSKDIEAYWKKFDGYKELANNEDEYSFSIKESKIRYTAKDKVQMGKDAQYDVYVKLLQEPTNKNRPVMFKNSLTKEQALKLYVACVKTNRKMLGAVPTDFKGLAKLKDIPAADMQKCQQTIRQSAVQNSAVQSVRQTRGGR